MTERSAEQAPVQTRPAGQESHQDTTRIPLAERLQRRISANGERRAAGQATHESSPRQNGRVLPPMPTELAQQHTEQRPATAPPAPQSQPSPQAEPQQRAVQAVPESRAEQNAQVPVVRVREATAARRTPSSPTRAPRRARLRLSRIDPWSVMKVSFLLSIAFGIVTVVSVFIVWSVLGAAGVWSSINNTVSDTVSSGNNVSTFNIEDYLGMSRVLGFTMLVSVIDVILITAIATLGAFLYIMSASLLGGVEVTLAEDS
jgi:hypothetical protein